VTEVTVHMHWMRLNDARALLSELGNKNRFLRRWTAWTRKRKVHLDLEYKNLCELYEAVDYECEQARAEIDHRDAISYRLGLRSPPPPNTPGPRPFSVVFEPSESLAGGRSGSGATHGTTSGTQDATEQGEGNG
jgi:hypothetical protein